MSKLKTFCCYQNVKQLKSWQGIHTFSIFFLDWNNMGRSKVSCRNMLWTVSWRNSFPTCDVHELVKICLRKQWFCERSEVTFQNTRNWIYLISIHHTSKRIFSIFKCFFELFDVNLIKKLSKYGLPIISYMWPSNPEDALMSHSKQVDCSNTAFYD